MIHAVTGPNHLEGTTMPAGTAAPPAAKKVVAPLSQDMNKQGEKMIASTSEYKGKTYVSCRIHYTDTATQELRPGKNGINIELSEAPKFFKAVDHLKRELGIR